MSCTDICIDMDVDSSCDTDFVRERELNARKSHICCECKREIISGERYQKVAGKNDNEMFSRSTCIECVEIRKSFVCGSFYYGWLWEEIENSLFPLWKEYSPIDCLAKLDSLGARNKMRMKYSEWQKLHGEIS